MTARDAGAWHPTTCNFCYVNCGLQVQVDGRRITRVRGDRNHPRSRGYLCQKAQLLTWYADHDDRLTTPLRRRADGTHESVDWETALGEIAERLATIRAEDAAAGRPGSFALVGAGGQGNHSAGPFATSLMKWMRSTRFFNPLSQEKTGDFWVNGKLFGGQTVHTAEDVEQCDLLLVVGANPWLAHGFARARAEITAIRNTPDRHLIVIDPRRTETAEAADLHLALRPGTDAFLLAAMLALLIRRHAVDHEFLAARTDGYEQVAEALSGIPVEEWIAHAGVHRAEVERAVGMIETAEAMSVRVELGIQQGRHSTLNSYLEKLLFLVTGHFGRPGTNAVHSWLQPLWSESRGERSEITGFEYIGGLLPMNTLAEELDPTHPHRARAVWVDSSNPANTVADTLGIETAIRGCELSVVVDIAYTETAALADYVLPAAAQNEKWEYALFTFQWPENSLALRPPVLDSLPGTLPEPEIYTRLLDRLGALPDEAELDAVAAAMSADRTRTLALLQPMLRSDPDLAAIAPVLLYRTLGRSLPAGADLAAVLWPGCQRAAALMPQQVARALALPSTAPDLGAVLFERLLTTPSGVTFSEHEYDEVWSLLRTDRIHLAVPELLGRLVDLDPSAEQPDPAYPLSLVNGQRRRHNANQILRPPEARRSDREGALHASATDLARAGVAEGDWAAVVSRHGRIIARAVVDESLHPGQVALPHGFGMHVPVGGGGRRVWYGPRINVLTDPADRDPIAGTPHHKDVRVRIEPADVAERQQADADRNIIGRLIEEHSS